MTNPIQMNNWEIKRFLIVILFIQLTIWAVIGLDAIGLEIPILRPVIVFIYLAFVPGIIILRILKVHKIGNVETLIYSVGLSLATIMFTGLFANTVYPLFGVSKPISLIPLMIMMSIVVLVLCAICYGRDRRFTAPSPISISDILSPPALFLCLVPFLSIFGAILVTSHHNNILLMFLMIVIALIVVLITLGKFIPRNLYPLAVYIIALSLLFHQSLLSQFIVSGRGDTMYEFALALNVLTNGQWDLTLMSMVNGMLSVTMIAPIFSNISGITITWLFKAIYPLIFALVPLGLYHIFQKQTNNRIAFLSCFFFVSQIVFYTEAFSNTRMIFAELFIVLLILLMTDKNMHGFASAVLSIIFYASLVVSHYSLSYIYLFLLIFAWLIVTISSKVSRQKNKSYISNPIPPDGKSRMLNANFVALTFVLAMAWYMNIAGSSAFNAIVHVGDHMMSTMSTEFLNPETSEGLRMVLTKTHGPLGHINKTINYLNQIFIIIGVLTLLLQRVLKKARILLGASLEGSMRFEKEYAAFSYVSFMILVAAVSIPYFTSAFNLARLYNMTTILLAPFFVVGSITLFNWIIALKHALHTSIFSNKKAAKRVSPQNKRNPLFLALIVSIIFHFFSTGFAYTIAGSGTSLALEYDNQAYRITHHRDIVAARWLYAHWDSGVIYVEGDYGHAPFTYAHLGSFQEGPYQQKRSLFNTITTDTLEEMRGGDFIHLRYAVVPAGRIHYKGDEIELGNTMFMREGNKIYSCGSVIYQIPHQE